VKTKNIVAIPLLLLPLTAACTLTPADTRLNRANASDPVDYPPPPPQRIYNASPQRVYTPAPQQYTVTYRDLSDATDELKGSLALMSDVVRRYGPDSYQRLRADMGDLNTRLDTLHYTLAQDRPYPEVRAAFTNVQTSAAYTDSLMNSMNAHPPVRASWNQFINSLRHAETLFR
jgi:hypothetical protein